MTFQVAHEQKNKIETKEKCLSKYKKVINENVGKGVFIEEKEVLGVR